MVEIDLPDTVTIEEDRRRWAAEQTIRVVCAAVSAQGSQGMATIDYALDKIADALDGFAKDGTINRVSQTQG